VYAATSDTSSLLTSEFNEVAAQAMYLGDAAAGARAVSLLNDGRWRALKPLNRPYPQAVMALVQTNKLADAKALLSEWQREIPDDMRRVQGWAMNTARGQILTAEKQGAAAVAALRAGDSTNCIACQWPLYARAFEAAGQRDSAIYYYEKYVTSKRFQSATQKHAFELAHAFRRLGELHEEAGRTKEALQRYRDFVKLWKNADAPLQDAVKQTQERIAKLEAGRR
jgi:tetratricopeptide (TPR) repeat protein